MASSSTSPLPPTADVAAASQPAKTYDVFVSFRGEDVRYNFLALLQDALRQNDINAFVDTDLERGEEITKSLVEKIEDSYISIIIFSERYASSPWCLDELVEILRCMKTKAQKVIPVFYRVKPDDVQKLTGGYGDALAEHRKAFEGSVVDKWGETLKEIAELSGLVSQDIGPDPTKLIDEIISHTSRKLNHIGSSVPYNQELVGMESRVEGVTSLLCPESLDVRVVGIWGKKGIGKSTIAKKAYDEIKHKFTSRCFVDKISERLEKGILHSVLNEIICAILGPKVLNEGNNITLSPSIAQRLARRKVFIVLDDVSDLEQIGFFTRHNIFGLGSRIIVTSRNEHLLRNVNAQICPVEPLDDREALCLFCLHAFKQSTPKQGYKALANKVVEIARGNPLALKSVGSELYSKSVEECEEKLKRFKGKSGNRIVKVIRKSNADSVQHVNNMLTKFGGPELSRCVDVLKLENYQGLDKISPLEQLYCLRELKLENLIDLVYVDFAGGNEEGPFFPSLKKLWISNCPNLKGWRKRIDDDEDDDDDAMPWFPCLSFLEINDCQKLVGMPLFPFVDERLYYVKAGCQPLQQTMKMKISRIRELWISGLSDLQYIDLDEDYYFSGGGAKEVFPVLKRLWIYDCPNLKGWWKRRDEKTTLPTPEQLPQFPCLYLLEIKKCPKLSWMPLFPFLDERLYYVKTGIQPLMQTLAVSSFSNLEELWLSELSDLQYIHGGERGSSSTAFLSLKKLWIDYCPTFEGWWKMRDHDDATTATFQFLSLLELKHCPKLSRMPLFPSLDERLYYVNVGIEPLLQTMKIKTSTVSAMTTLKELWLSELTYLEYLDSERQEESATNVLPCLNKLWISYCPNLKGWWKKSDADDTTWKKSVGDDKTLAQLPQFPCLSSYDIKECPQLKHTSSGN